MAKHDLSDIAADQLNQAHGSPEGRSSQTLVGDDEGLLQHTVVALTEGHTVAARESTEHSTLQVLTGSVRIRSSDGMEDAGEGDLVEIPTGPHLIRAEEDTAALLTESKSAAGGGWDSSVS